MYVTNTNITICFVHFSRIVFKKIYLRAFPLHYKNVCRVYVLGVSGQMQNIFWHIRKNVRETIS